MDLLPQTIRPMLAQSAEAFDDEEWYFEVKWDGIRCLLFWDERLRLQSRNGNDITHRFPELQTLYDQIDGAGVILDGELIVFKDGAPDFDRVKQRNLTDNPGVISRLSHEWPATYVAFDILYLQGKVMMHKPWSQRRSALESTLDAGPRGAVSQGVPAQGQAFYQACIEKGLEGVVGKLHSAPYTPGRRSPAWKKVRNTREGDFVVGGYTPRGTMDFGALLVGVFAGENLIFAGHVGSGFSDDERRVLRAGLTRIAQPDSPFKEIPRDLQREDIEFVTPALVVSVEYLRLTPAGRLRHPVWKGVRSDKQPEECCLDQLMEVHT